jgi:hypothetical protein
MMCITCSQGFSLIYPQPAHRQPTGAREVAKRVVLSVKYMMGMVFRDLSNARAVLYNNRNRFKYIYLINYLGRAIR